MCDIMTKARAMLSTHLRVCTTPFSPLVHLFSPPISPAPWSERAEHDSDETSMNLNIQCTNPLTKYIPGLQQGAGTQRHCTTAKSTDSPVLNSLQPSDLQYVFQSILLPCNGKTIGALILWKSWQNFVSSPKWNVHQALKKVIITENPK